MLLTQQCPDVGLITHIGGLDLALPRISQKCLPGTKDSDVYV